MMRIRNVVLVSLWAALLSGSMPSANLPELVSHSDYIAVARVEEVFESDGHKWAKARATNVLKGKDNVNVVYFLAEPTWTCDTSTAEVGEMALLFLADIEKVRASHEAEKQKNKDALGEVAAIFEAPPVAPKVPAYLIAWSGRGRLPIRQLGTEPLATVFDVILPEGTPTLPGPYPEYDFIRSIKLSYLLNLVNAEMSRGTAPN